MGCLQSKGDASDAPREQIAAPSPLFASPPDAAKENGAPATIKNTDAEKPAHAPSRAPPKKQRSALKRDGTPRKEDDEDSDWDNCSNSGDYQDAEDGPKSSKGSNGDLKSPKKPVEQATQQAMSPTSQLNYRETTTLRIDKVKGCMFVNQYLLVKFLGRGACGKVFLCLNTHDLRLCAMKAVRKTDLEAATAPPPPPAANGAPAPTPKPKRNPMDDLKREIMIMRKMKHANIVTLSEVIDDPSGSKLLLIMEYLDGGPVLTREALEKREKLPEPLALNYFRDMIKALDYLHAHKVIHGDLKPENVLMMASGSVKLSDFGCSKLIATKNEYLDRCNGTPAFLAPEMMKPNTRYRGRPTDIYALGACLYTLLFGRIPFSAPNLYKLFQTVQNDPVKYPEDIPISRDLRDILNRMFHKDPRQRITLPEIMSHPWTSMQGKYPLKPFKELTEGETQEDHDRLGDTKIDYVLGNPKVNALAGLLDLSRHERTFNEGDVIMRQGENATYLLLIVSGTVDVIVKWALPPMKRASQLMVKPGEAAMPSSSQDEFMDESEAMSPIIDVESKKNRMKLQRAATKARDFIFKLQSAATPQAGGAASPSNLRSLLIAQRGPGDLIGDMGLFSKVRHRHATVKCTSPVVARVILPDQLEEYMARTPLAKSQLRESILLKESEVSMVEALTKLSNALETITASLRVHETPDKAPPASPPMTSGP